MPKFREMRYAAAQLGGKLKRVFAPKYAINGAHGKPSHPKSNEKPQLSPPAASVERLHILAELEHAARRGFVPAEALIHRLHASYLDELAEERRQLDALEQALDGNLRRIDTLFPAPLPPVPEPTAPPRARRFGPIGDIWASNGAAARY